jgi:hypothetical protein
MVRDDCFAIPHHERRESARPEPHGVRVEGFELTLRTPMQLYQEELLDHYRNPRHKGRLVQPHFKSGQHNP